MTTNFSINIYYFTLELSSKICFSFPPGAKSLKVFFIVLITT